ncbi:MAG TPA: glycosyltransferase, partial [Myxococcaceae bacterium]|nr:glycosyltransferase [Myxococcaceae bacterium]
MVVHQLVSSFVSGDASGQAALHFQLLLRRLGRYGEIFAGEVEPALSALAQPVAALRPAPDDLVLYHHGIASPLAGRLLHLECRRGVVFHSVSPVRFYLGTPLAEALMAGRAQLAALAPRLDVAIGVSRFNAAELVEAGAPADKVHVVSLFVEPERFKRENADTSLLKKLAPSNRRSPVVLSVSRVAPHKRIEDLLALHEELLRIAPDAELVVAGRYEPGSAYWKMLRRRSRGLRGVRFLGPVTHAQLVALYRAASVFVSMSEHEGFGVPLLEAMASELPVLAFAAAAVPETLGGAGIAFTEKRFGFLAELVQTLQEDRELRARILQGQARRLGELSAGSAASQLATALNRIDAPPQGRRRSTGPGRVHLALVVQRFGEEVSGGAEKHALDLARKLETFADVTVLTTCATDHLSWENVLPAGEDRDGGIRIRRFRVASARRMSAFNRLSRARFGIALDRMHEEHWIAAQGPVVPELFRHLAEEGARYDAFLFFTYLYAPTVWGLPLVADRSLLVPTAHDEPPLAFHAYADAFERPRALLCNTPEEEALIRRRFVRHARTRVVGVGVDALPGDPARFAAKFRLERPYLFYVGRIEPGKGIGELVQHYRALRRERADPPDLVL